MKRPALLLWIFLILACGTAPSQTTAFTYQGSLTGTTLAANGTYDFQFLRRNNDGIQRQFKQLLNVSQLERNS